MFKISPTPLEGLDLKSGLHSPQGGALATFEGFVRRDNGGKAVTDLEYEAFEKAALSEGEAILSEARDKFNLIAVNCFHRIGRLKVGDMAVWIGAVAGHRREAMEACRYIIDELKKRLPIWKKEHYENAAAEWINCKVSDVSFDREAEYYSRQLNLKDVGKEGQERLKNARVLVVGAGGLGAPALLYLASCGVGTIGIADSDLLETSNLHRQVIYGAEDVGRPKAELAAARLRSLNPFIHVRVYPKRVKADNIYDIAPHYSLILDCSDNFPTKFLLNDFAVISKIPLISASVYQLEGQMFSCNPKADSSCLRCLWPDMPDAACTGVCDTAGILGVVPGVFGTFQAAEAVKHILGLPGQLKDELLTMDLTAFRTQKIRLPKNSDCPVCSKSPSIKVIDGKRYEIPAETDVEIAKFSKEEFFSHILVDVREAAELTAKPVAFKDSEHIPASSFDQSDFPFDKEKKYLIFCEMNLRSRKIARKLKERGIANAFSVVGGADAVRSYLASHRPGAKEGVSR